MCPSCIRRRRLIQRSLLTGLAAACPGFLIHTPSHALWPLLFLRLGVSAVTRSSAARLGTTVARSAVRTSRPRAVTRTRTSAARTEMARGSRSGDRDDAFDKIVSDTVWDVLQDSAWDAIIGKGAAAYSPQIALIHAETRDGTAQCVAFTSNVDSDRPTTFLESPELLALGKITEAILCAGASEELARRVVWPLECLNVGSFTYAHGHSTPTLYRTSEGSVRLDSQVTDADNATVTFAFRPKSGSDAPSFASRYILKNTSYGVKITPASFGRCGHAA